MKAAQFLTCLLLPFAFLLLPLFLVLFQLAAGYPVPSAQLDEVVPALELHTHVEEPSRDSERRGDEGRVRVREPEQEARGREQRVGALRGRRVGAQGQAYDRAPLVDRERRLRELELARHGLRVQGLAGRQALLRLRPQLGREVVLVRGRVRVDVVARGYVER